MLIRELPILQPTYLKGFKDKDIVEYLLQDCTTGGNIVWGTEQYAGQEINTGSFWYSIRNGIIQPRVEKNREIQKARTKQKAEVYTPTWICNKMNNMCDTDIVKVGFNREQTEKTWQATGRVEFQKGYNWRDYVRSKRLEITCGEAPFLVSRYDTITGEPIGVRNRVGILDRKLRVINENVTNEKNWTAWVIQAYKATYGYEYQGDSLVIARINLIQSMIENYEYRFGKEPKENLIYKVLEIIAWNIWQMDGRTMTVPYSEGKQTKGYEPAPNGQLYARIKDWEQGQEIEFRQVGR